MGDSDVRDVHDVPNDWGARDVYCLICAMPGVPEMSMMLEISGVH
jgi:hypothetical protein